ncbi:UDP-N-acetylglucosamine transferase subunit ALG14 isoform X2 [Helianthus annuus]|uniref:UDP-N-acetylglucosamine transferase subunit ALG14 isoform X2 n=1 Tax=Helianthus annuus TaxID=4232 RepID=UPI000B8F7BBF|nr:UDP-N-acetylglucosamine transferase subunit ALG14 isoform X2 [Helianthus annuus]
MVDFVSVSLVFVIASTLLVVRILYVISQSSKPARNASQKSLSTLVVLGSGGHTAEMINLLTVLQKERFAPRFYIAAATDNMSLQKARVFEDTLDDKISLKGANSIQFMQIYRSREVGQSYITSVGTTLYALAHALWLMVKIRPQVILCNGPGTCIPICAIAFVFKDHFRTISIYRTRRTPNKKSLVTSIPFCDFYPLLSFFICNFIITHVN